MKIAVAKGAHPFPEREFDAVNEGMENVDFVREELDAFVADPNRGNYDAVVFYNFHQELDERAKDAILELADAGRGIVVLHHAVLAFPKWEEWRKICGVDVLSFGYDDGQEIRVHVEDSDHPITAGLSDWDMVDETYRMRTPDDDCHVLLTVDHPNSMTHLAWARTYRNSRVFWFQSGHDDKAYSSPQFHQVIEQAIRWTAGR